MTRFDKLTSIVERYQAMAAENYSRIRRLAEEIADGLCGHLDTADGPCVHLVPPAGPFEPRPYGDQAFSVAPKGFRPLGPVAFGVAVRVSRGTDWLRVTLECRKLGETFVVQIAGGPEYKFELPLRSHSPEVFYQMVISHVTDWFSDQMNRYQDGEYGAREIGFDFAEGA